MSNYGRLGVGSADRARFPVRLVCAALALSSAALAGCQGLGSCGGGPCREPGPLSRVGQRMFNRQPSGVVVDGCEPGLIGGAPMPMGAPAPIINGPGAAIEDSPALELAPAEPTSGAAPLNNSSSNPTGGTNPTSSRQGAGRAVYETLKANDGPPVARRELSTSPSAGGDTVADPLANLPKLDPPGELGSLPAPVAPDASEIAKPGVENTNASPAATSLAPGFRSFKVVEPRLAGGSLPGSKGWGWLAEQGYKTVLDLRPSHELRSEDLATVNASGLRYVALPMTDASIDDAAQLARFAAEVGQDSARPLYFFDTDGSRASVLWYVHQVAQLKASPAEAARAAEEIGPRDSALWQRADALIAKLQPTGTAPASDSNSAVPPTAVPSAPATKEANATTTPKGDESRQIPTVENYVTELFGKRPNESRGGDPTAWKPFAALAAAGLTVPLAIVGRAAIPRRTSRASLTAPERATRAIGHGSGA